MRAAIGEMPARGPAAPSMRPPVYRTGDPALRLFAGFALPLPPATLLSGAIATLSGVRDGEHERLLIDLGTSLVRSAPRRDEKAGTLGLMLSRTQTAETYAALLGSLRYVNDAPAPTNGVRKIVLETIDAGGRAKEVASARFGVGEAPPEADAIFVVGGKGVRLGEKPRFNSDGDYTLFWWPRLLPAAAARVRRARPAEAEAPTGSHFSAGGRLYRLFDPEAERPGPPEPVRAPARPANARAVSGSVWVPEGGVPPPRFERARALRLEDVFGSDMQERPAGQRRAAGR